MTVSTDAVLFYGYCWDEETCRPWVIGCEDEEDSPEGDSSEDRYARAHGVLAPAMPYPECTEAIAAAEARVAELETQLSDPGVCPTEVSNLVAARTAARAEVERLRMRGGAPTDYTPVERAIIDAYHAYWDRRRELAEASPCDVLTHCSKECPMPYVFVKASWVHFSRGEMTEVRGLAVDPAWDGQLAEFCATMGIETGGLRAAWWLVSNWS